MASEQTVEYILGASEPAPDEPLTSEEQSADEPPEYPLTRREREVADLIGRGLTNRQVSSELLIFERTVHNRVRNILSKLGLGSRGQIAVWVTRREMLP